MSSFDQLALSKTSSFLSTNAYLCRSYTYAAPRAVVTEALPTSEPHSSCALDMLTLGMCWLAQGFFMPRFYWGSKPEGIKPTKHSEVIFFPKDLAYGQGAWKYLAFFHFGFLVLVSSFSSLLLSFPLFPWSLKKQKLEKEEKEKRR